MKIQKPPRLKPNATIGIVAPSLPLLPGNHETYAAGKQLLSDWGFQLREGVTIGLEHWWSAGTPRQQADDIHAISLFEGAILFWEEVGTTLYDITLDLHKLKHAGAVERLDGMVVGQIAGINEYFEEVAHPSLREAVMESLDGYDFPVLAGVDFGHYRSMLPLPIGIEAHLDAAQKELAVVEAAVL